MKIIEQSIFIIGGVCSGDLAIAGLALELSLLSLSFLQTCRHCGAHLEAAHVCCRSSGCLMVVLKVEKIAMASEGSDRFISDDALMVLMSSGGARIEHH